MRSIIFSNYSAIDTHRLGATIDVEHSHLRFLGNTTLNLWDCGGQNVFIENHLTTQRDHIFRMVEVLIYVFDISSKEVPKDMETFLRCLENLQEYSPRAKVFVLLHKMDLVRADRRDQIFEATMNKILESSKAFDFTLTGFSTSIWDESLYKAWSTIVCSLVSNMGKLQEYLQGFADANNVKEVILFERTTFLVISHVTVPELESKVDPKRFEKISNIIKSYRQSCSKLRSQLQSIVLESSTCKAVIEALTSNTFLMLVMSPDTTNTNLAILNIRAVREKFEELEQAETSR